MRPVQLQCLQDNVAAIRDMEVGYSKKLRYLRRHHRLSLGLLRDSLDREGVEGEHVVSAENTSDVMTKAQPKDAFNKCVVSMGMDML